MTETHFYEWAALPVIDLPSGGKRRLVVGEHFMVVQFTFKAGDVVPLHDHPNEQMTHFVYGKAEFEVDGKTKVVHGGEIIYIPANVPHQARFLADTVTLEVFSPPREDFIETMPHRDEE